MKRRNMLKGTAVLFGFCTLTAVEKVKGGSKWEFTPGERTEVNAGDVILVRTQAEVTTAEQHKIMSAFNDAFQVNGLNRGKVKVLFISGISDVTVEVMKDGMDTLRIDPHEQVVQRRP